MLMARCWGNLPSSARIFRSSRPGTHSITMYTRERCSAGIVRITLGWSMVTPISSSRLKAVEEHRVGFHGSVGNFERNRAPVA